MASVIEIITYGNMNKLVVVASGSSGNSYLLDASGEQLIIECGVPAKDIFKLLEWRIGNVAACICSHQ